MTRPLYDWFHAAALVNRDGVALVADGVEVSYGQLDAAAAQTAELALGVAPHASRMATLGSRSPASYVGYLAALRSGRTVVPLAADGPVDRAADIVRRSGVDVLLHPPEERELALAVSASVGIPAVAVPERGGGAPGPPASPPESPGADDVAYIVFTSGSSGRPKGVPIRHRHVDAYLRHVVPLFGGGPDVRASQTADLVWDLSVWNLWVPWAGGGTVVVPTRAQVLAPVRHITEDRITHWFSVPSSITISRRLGELVPGSLPTLRWSLFGGELLTVDNARAWQEAAPHGVLANVYGPTETTCTILTYPAPADVRAWPRCPHDALPMGGAYPTVETCVVGDHGLPAEEGELLVRGAQRFDGYLEPEDDIGRFARLADGRMVDHDGDEPLTREHWYRSGDVVRRVPGGYAFIHRVDSQVKVYGHRVEPGEVEAAARSCPGVDEAVVVPRRDEDGANELAMFYTGRALDDLTLRDHMHSRVPGYMVPRFLVRVSRLPLTANGKADRRRLAARARQEPHHLPIDSA